MSTVAIISAAGLSKRMGQPKLFLDLGGQTVLERTLVVFQATKVIDEIILVVNQEDVERSKKLSFSKIKQVIIGGQERQDSVCNGLKALPTEADIVAVHDGARPLVTPAIVERAVAEAKKTGAAVVGMPVKDTIKQITNDELRMTNEGITILKTLERKQLWQAQTPQVFKKDILLKAYEAKGIVKATDDAMLVEKLGHKVTMVLGSYANIKITTPEDLIFAQAIVDKGGK